MNENGICTQAEPQAVADFLQPAYLIKLLKPTRITLVGYKS